MRLKLQRVDARYADDAFSVRRIRKAYAIITCLSQGSLPNVSSFMRRIVLG
jgi:hypothetical protein